MTKCCNPQRGAHPTVPSTPQPTDSAGTVKALARMAPEQLRMVGLAGGVFLMGSEDPEAYPEDHEGPVRQVTIEPFAIAATTVTNAQFAAFVAETGYVTDAERSGDSLVFVGLLPKQLRATTLTVQAAPWWRQVPGATWFYPCGDDTSVLERPDHPVTHVSHRDALAYAQWSGTRLLNESEWEYAARGGLEQQPYPWGEVRQPDGVARMQTFSGRFPDQPDAAVGTVAADAFEPNAYGLYNMTGNVWEWTASQFSAAQPDPVLRGGSYMCHDSYCRRYRTSARSSATSDTSLGHTGFRVGLSV